MNFPSKVMTDDTNCISGYEPETNAAVILMEEPINST